MTAGFQKLETPRGEGRAMTTLLPTSVDISYGRPANLNGDASGSNWFGPLQPMLPLAPEAAGRAWDYAPGWNLQQRPRSEEPVDFATLRLMADALDPLRLVIERRKDQIARLAWTIHAKHDGGAGKRPNTAQLSSATRSRLREIEAFFRRPSFDWSFRDWLRSMIEDVLVTDAPALYCERDGVGELIGLKPIDGTTVKRVIGQDGQRPRPFAWDGTTFEWLGAHVTQSNFAALGFKMRGGLVYPPAFVQILKGVPAANLTELDLLYRPLNRRTHKAYGFSPVEQVVSTVSIALQRTRSQGDYYREGNLPEGLYSLPENWTPNQVQNYQEYFDNLFVGNLGARRQLKFMAGGGKSSYVELKEPPLKREFDEWLVRIICFAFSYPPSAFVELSNRSIAEQHDRTAEREGLEPLKAWTADLINEVIVDEFGDDEIEFAWAEEDEIDPEKQAKILSTYVAAGILTANEARERLGEEPSASPAANELMIRTNNDGDVPVTHKENQNAKSHRDGRRGTGVPGHDE